MARLPNSNADDWSNYYSTDNRVHAVEVSGDGYLRARPGDEPFNLELRVGSELVLVPGAIDWLLRYGERGTDVWAFYVEGRASYGDSIYEAVSRNRRTVSPYSFGSTYGWQTPGGMTCIGVRRSDAGKSQFRVEIGDKTFVVAGDSPGALLQEATYRIDCWRKEQWERDRRDIKKMARRVAKW